MALLEFNFESEYLNGNTNVSIIVPDKKRGISPAEFYGSDQKYKVLWLLHGTFGDHSDWLRKSNIELYACEKDLIVVMPSGLNANYANWESFSIGYNMYDYLVKELMPFVYGWLPASDKREDNFIAGLSMGGRGSLLYASNFPELFAGCAVLSAAAAPLDNLGKDETNHIAYRNLIRAKHVGGVEVFKNSYENIWRNIDEKAASGVLPRFYVAVGSDDRGAENCRRFAKHLEELGLESKFTEIPGYAHEWRFWDITIQEALEYFGLTGKDEGNPF